MAQIHVPLRIHDAKNETSRHLEDQQICPIHEKSKEHLLESDQKKPNAKKMRKLYARWENTREHLR